MSIRLPGQASSSQNHPSFRQFFHASDLLSIISDLSACSAPGDLVSPQIQELAASIPIAAIFGPVNLIQVYPSSIHATLMYKIYSKPLACTIAQDSSSPYRWHIMTREILCAEYNLLIGTLIVDIVMSHEKSRN